MVEKKPEETSPEKEEKEKVEKPSTEPEEVEEAGLAEDAIEIEGVKYKKDPDDSESPLIGENGKPVPYEEKKEEEEEEEEEKEKEEEEKKEEEGVVEIDGLKYKEDPDNPGEALMDGKDNPILFEKPKRTPQTVPLYKLRIAEKKWGKEKTDYQKTIDDLKIKLKDHPDTERDTEIEKFATANKMNPDVLKGLIKLVSKTGGIVSDELKGDVEKLKETATWSEEFKQFNTDFAKNVLPLLETDKISPEDSAIVKRLIKAKAFSTEYSNTPLQVIYRGDSDFDKFRNPPKGKKTAEPGGKVIRGKEKPGGKNVLAMDDKEFDEFDKDLEKEAKEKKFKVRRQGEDVEV